MTVQDTIRERARELLAQRRKELERYDWPKVARPNQLPPDSDWRTWLLLAGRGFGKTRTGAEWVRAQVESGKCKRMALVAPTAADARDVMVEGESGLLAVSRPDFRPIYEASKRRLTWPNGAIATTYSADQPERLRGPQHDGAWADELGAWRYRDQAWAMLMFGLRIGTDPRVVVTTTPKPVQLIRDLRKAKSTALTRGSTYDNRANLAPQFFDEIIKKYEGTRLGRQELDAELLDDVPDSLWKRAWFDALRIAAADLPELIRIVVAIDPAVTSEDESDQTGIVVVGKAANGHAYVLEDLSCRVSPSEWATKAIEAYKRWNADGIVAEVNQGGDLVETTLRAVDADIPYRAVRASRGKHLRAEPISALYEQGKVHHVGTLNTLEDQMCAMLPDGYTGAGSPDVLDAAVHGLTEIMQGAAGAIAFFSEFRSTARPNEPAEALHVIPASTYLQPWWHRWISIGWGKSPAMHWWAQHQEGRVHVYRELLPGPVSAEEAGALLAEASLEELANVRHLTAWIAPDYFDAALGRKSIAQQISEGVESVLGKGSSFLFALTEDERMMDPDAAWKSLARRREKIAGSALLVQAPKDDTAGGWEHLRSLLRWWPLHKPAAMEYDRDLAQSLVAEEDGARKFHEYLRHVEGKSDELLPGLLIHDLCPETIRALSALTRSEKDPSLPAETEASFPAWSLLYGAIAHRDFQAREPLDAFTARRVESAKQNNPQLDGTAVHNVARKAEIDYKRQELTTFRFARLPRKPR